MNVTDKRRGQRFAMAIPAAVKLDELGINEADIKTKDISSGGVYFEFVAPIDVGSSLQFVLTLPREITQDKSVRVKCKGKVVRVDRTGVEGSAVGIAATIERYEFLRDT